MKYIFNSVKHTNLYADQDAGFELAICKVLRENIQRRNLSAVLVRNSRINFDTYKFSEEEYKETYKWVPQQAPVVTGKSIDAYALTPLSSNSFLGASLHGVDNYFQLLRRRINMVERPILSQSRSETWNGYGAYNPKYFTMLIEIFRVYNNYVLTDKKHLTKSKYSNPKNSLTPAQKLGLLDEEFSIHDILDYTPAREFIKLKNIS